jgi:hypothetical protein
VHDAPLGEAGTIRARFERDPGAAALRAIAGVTGAERADDGAWLLAADAARAAGVAAAAAAGDWGLCELIPDYDALEQLFMRLTSGAGGSAPA